jgi:hypothetical protein
MTTLELKMTTLELKMTTLELQILQLRSTTSLGLSGTSNFTSEMCI